MNMETSQIKSTNSLIQSNHEFNGSSSLARRLDDQKNSKLTQYYNVTNQSFQNSHNALKNPKQQTDRSDNLNLQIFSSFPSQKYEVKTFPSPKNKLSFTHQNFYTNQNHFNTQNLPINSRLQNLKESKIQQSLQKAFSLNRNSHRIPFKKKQNYHDQSNLNQGKKGYNFYEPSYDEYFTKQHRKFWIQAFEKFYQKRGSIQNIDFPSFHNKDQSKNSDQYSQNYKKNDDFLKQKSLSNKDPIKGILKNKISLNTILLISILIIGLVILIKK